MTFLLFWDKGSYIESFLVIFPCIVNSNGLSPLIFFILPYSISYSGFIWLKNSIVMEGSKIMSRVQKQTAWVP
jgi:hypothetical protein